MLRTTSALLFLLGSTTAQVAVGDIAITGFSSTAFGILRGAAVTGYTTPGFLGTGSSQAILWDRQNPNAFLVAGFGFIGRATILGPSSVSYALITANAGIVSQMSWDDSGQVVFVDSQTNQVRRLDPLSGAVVDLSSGAQPWGSNLSAGAWNPVNGDVVVGGSGEIYRLPAGAATGVPVVSGLGGVVSGIQFDPLTGDIIATVLTVNRVIRVDASGAVSNVAPPFSVPGPNALDVDQNGDFITGGGTGQVYRVPRTGGAPIFLANNTSPANAVNGLAVAGAGGFALPFGQACNASAGPATLRASGSLLVGGTVTTTSSNHAANAPGILVLGLSRTNHLGVPLPFLLDPLLGTLNCRAYVSLDVTQAGIGNAVAPADLAFALPLTAPFAGQTFFAQHACLEPVPGNLSWSNGLMLRVP